MIVEDYFGDVEDVEAVLQWLQKERPNRLYGVNVLDQFEKTYQLAEAYGAKFMQVDSVAGHLPPQEDPAYGALQKVPRKGHCADVWAASGSSISPFVRAQPGGRFDAWACSAAMPLW